MNNYLNELNAEQQKAVLHKDGALMVIAGPGSGKTRVLTYRIAHLIKQNINPFNILALTFTNKAAKEMKKRIEQIVGYQDVQSIWMGTFHSIFSRILRSECEKINYPRNFTIYDREDCKSLIRSIIKELSLDRDIYKISLLQNRISSLKNNFITPENYHENADLIQTDKIAKRTEFGKIFQMYVNRCETASAMDFDDLLLKTYLLLNDSPEALLKYQHQFKYILIDEYQDTNYIQYLIIKKLAALNENICVVGDDAQSIYAFRGANIKNILNFKSDYPEHKIYKLEQNYRSTVAIVDTANSLISYNEKQIEKKIWTNNSIGKPIILCKTGSDNDEGRLVANTIFDISLMDQAKNSDFAVLYRTNAQSRTIEEALRKKNIPYKIYGGVSFYQRKEVKDLLAYFRLVINPNDEEAFKRIINYPARGIGKTTLLKISVAANMNQISIWEAIHTLDLKINKGTVNKLKEFTLLIDNYRLASVKRNSYDIAEEIAKDSGIFHHLYNDKSPEGVSRFENIQELLNGIKDFCENSEEGQDRLQHFMQEVALITEIDSEKKEDIKRLKAI